MKLSTTILKDKIIILISFLIILSLVLITLPFNININNWLKPKNNSKPQAENKTPPAKPRKFAIIWWTDFNHNKVVGFGPDGKVVWTQNMSAPPIPSSSWYYIGGVERITVAPNGNLITSYGDAMIVQEIDRKTHNLIWQYGITGLQSYRGGFLDEPHKSWKINDHEVVINDSNDREVIIVDQNTNKVVWQYGQYHVMSSAPGLLRGNTSVAPVNGGQQFLITDTLEKKIMLIDRATKNVLWQWAKPDSQWLENVFVTNENTYVLSDRLKGEVFEINQSGQMLWDLTKLSDEEKLSYPTDTAKLDNGDVLIAEAGKNRVVETIPATGQVVREYIIHGMVSTIAVDYNNLDLSGTVPQINSSAFQSPGNSAEKKTFTVDDSSSGNSRAVPAGQNGGGQTISGKVEDVNASTGRAGSFDMQKGNINYGVEVYNYSRVVNKNGSVISLGSLTKDDNVTVTGSLSGTYMRATLVQDNSK